ncbi:hypothetical protein TVAG_187990 [Trichomonas vaginalis G3]|uniref:DUF3447 domain-containing protein n=1 Tax=Trichomonas vaginalis (strain ATCC PRA-98 / G3) TaxID=412133 RepID=A2DV21_TRIV3|nr:protein of unknown function (DUF3447) [Trichomonas vaginalis G3]EAY15748.1 hypothetical protein TVAG_187990 [Trichomonas vaginalis G3]KAI5486523.1 protein of unknown function (DUF3447) [Trichomonas vaginalis G3]|eukprot:XP_001327971.1 hypothetical protein [Trichomonas vaginalis G3]
MIKTNLIDSQKCLPQIIIKDILDIIPYNNRYTKSYLSLAKLISDDYQVKEVSKVNLVSNFLFYKEYGIKLHKSADFKIIKSENLDILKENTIYRALMNNDLEVFISFTEIEGFDGNQKLESNLFRDFSSFFVFPSENKFSLLELCCYYGAVDCFKFLRTEFDSAITKLCLVFSFLGRNQEIMSECLKHQKPDRDCMKYAIISHNIDFVTFLVNEYAISIDLFACRKYNNLDSFLVFFDQTNLLINCLIYSPMFNIPSLCEYFLSLGADINKKLLDERTALQIAAHYNSKEAAEFLISHGVDINEKDTDGVGMR